MHKKLLKYILLLGILLFIWIIIVIYSESIGVKYLDDSIEKLSESIVKNIPKNTKPIIAVFDFTDEKDQIFNGGNMVQHKLESSTALKNISYFIERGKVRKLIEELNFQHSDLFDATKSKKIGKSLGADKLLYGEIFIEGKDVTIYASLTDVETFVKSTEKISISIKKLPEDFWTGYSKDIKFSSQSTNFKDKILLKVIIPITIIVLFVLGLYIVIIKDRKVIDVQGNTQENPIIVNVENSQVDLSEDESSTEFSSFIEILKNKQNNEFKDFINKLKKMQI